MKQLIFKEFHKQYLCEIMNTNFDQLQKKRAEYLFSFLTFVGLYITIIFLNLKPIFSAINNGIGIKWLNPLVIALFFGGILLISIAIIPLTFFTLNYLINYGIHLSDKKQSKELNKIYNGFIYNLNFHKKYISAFLIWIVVSFIITGIFDLIKLNIIFPLNYIFLITLFGEILILFYLTGKKIKKKKNLFLLLFSK